MTERSSAYILLLAVLLLFNTTIMAQDGLQDDFGGLSDDFGGLSDTENENPTTIDDSMPDGDVKQAMLTVLEREPFRFSIAFLKNAIAKGADINARNKMGESVLIMAVRQQRKPETIEFLLQNGANPFATDSIGLTDMETIVESEYSADILPVFVKAGVNINQRNKEDGESLLAHAIAFDQSLKVARKLIELGANIESDTLTACSRCKDKEFLQLILNKIPDINKIDQKGRLALLEFAENAQETELIKALLEKGATIDARDEQKNTALIVAVAKNRNPEIASFLMQNGADVNAANKTGRTPFLAAVESGKLDLARALIKSGADINARTSKEESALMLAIKGKNKNIEQTIKDLLDAGVDPTVMDEECQTAYDLAEYYYKEKLDSDIFKRLKTECSKHFIAK